MKKAIFEPETALNMFPLDHSIIHSHSLDASRGKSLSHHLFSSKQAAYDMNWFQFWQEGEDMIATQQQLGSEG